MSGYTLTYRQGSPDAAALRPGVDPATPDDMFDAEGEACDRLTLRNLPPMNDLGAEMDGGLLVIDGDAGDHVGRSMRRGVILVRGRAGACPGFRMGAGTIVIERGPYDHPGLEMRRGTIICLDALQPLQSNGALTEEGEFELSAVSTLALILRNIGGDITHERWRLFSGDRFELNKGEIWQPVS